MRHKFHIPVFRIFYSTIYTILLAILFVFLAITPGELIYQAIKVGSFQYIFIIAGVYLFTALFALFIYASRLYTNRSVLAGIPKSYVPVEPGEVGSSVRRMIAGNLERSARLAWDSRPRDIRPEIADGGEEGGDVASPTLDGSRGQQKHHSDVKDTLIPIVKAGPPWGHIAHPGWSSPSSPDLPDLPFSTVIPELPNLIEAKAVSLAPADPAFLSLDHFVPDAHIVAVLQRPATMGLRDYLAHLSTFGLVSPPSLSTTFLSRYEYARFSTLPLTEPQFRDLMSAFADILAGMTELHPNIIAELQGSGGQDGEDVASLAASSSTGNSNDAGSAMQHGASRFSHAGQPRYASSHSSSHDRSLSPSSPVTVRTAPSYIRIVSGRSQAQRSVSPMPSYDSLSSVRRTPYATPYAGQSSSSSSLRSAGSVVRHAPQIGVEDLAGRFETHGS
ncbi:hypothetical protein B0A49_03338 [Cryomyces minteri]|uniref:Defect at low temperature protein 1 n=1 Tax=Cryomyces minteri TaxID=331657 RepID=A0A4V5NHK1_9PEZI|nr:hypothetical protein B0A49_03601 [Cryomyces minteri]TKA79399.1 hypothetical protein B0A49_03338 [Cryomyces minteri]